MWWLDIWDQQRWWKILATNNKLVLRNLAHLQLVCLGITRVSGCAHHSYINAGSAISKNLYTGNGGVRRTDVEPLVCTWLVFGPLAIASPTLYQWVKSIRCLHPFSSEFHSCGISCNVQSLSTRANCCCNVWYHLIRASCNCKFSSVRFFEHRIKFRVFFLL